MPFKVCGYVCISLMAYSLIWHYTFDWLACANNFPKMALKVGLYSLLLISISYLQVAGPPASLLQGELWQEREIFLPVGTLKGWTKNQYYSPLRWLFLQVLLKQKAFLPCDSFEFGSQTQSAHFEAPIRLYSAEKRSHVSVVKTASFFRSKAKTDFWNTG